MTNNHLIKYTATFAIIGGLGIATVAGAITASAHGMQVLNNPEVQKALIARDLGAYKQAVHTNNAKKTQTHLDTITQEKLNTMSDNYTKMQALHTRLTDTIKAGDKLNDYKTVLTEIKALKEANKPAKADGKIDKPGHSQPTDAQIEARYNEQVAQYKKDGTLPEIGGKGHGPMGERGPRGSHGKR